MNTASRLAAALAAATVVASAAAGAQAPAPATPTVTPTPKCERPGPAPAVGSTETGKVAAAEKRRKWTEAMGTYLDCLKAFHAEQEAAAAPHIRAANATIEEYKRAAKEYTDYRDLLNQQ